jgi:RHS repeat-associated protein
VRQLTNSAGAVTDAYEYDAFGNLIAQTGTTPNAYLYRSERYDSDLGLYYLRARWYNPATGRFMSRDPYEGSIYDPASLHRYNYARANPVNYVDPSGRSNLTEYALDLSLNTIATGGVVTSLGFSVKCAYFTVASSLHLVGETLGQQVDQFTPLFKSCAAKITTTQFVTAWAANTALLTLNVLAGPALRAVGDWMFGAEQGMDWRLLTEEEGSIGPRGPLNDEEPVLQPYNEGGGHHVPAKSMFRGAPNYDPNTALAIPQSELDNLNLDHGVISGAQQVLYRAYAQTGQPLTWDVIQSIETEALITGGANPNTAAAIVNQAINALKAAGVSGPTRIPWGG